MPKKKSSTFVKYLLFSFKWISSILLALLISIASKELANFGWFSFMFVFLTLLFAYWQLIKPYRFFGVFFINLFLISLVLLIGVYIHYAYKS